MDGRMDGWTFGWMDGWTDGRLDGWTDGRMDGWGDGSIEQITIIPVPSSLVVLDLRGFAGGARVKLGMPRHLIQRTGPEPENVR